MYFILSEAFLASGSPPLLQWDPQLTLISVLEEPSLKSILVVGTSSFGIEQIIAWLFSLRNL